MNKDMPLGLPEGSVRAVITIMLLVMLGITIFLDVGEASMAVVAGLTGTAVSSYFGSRKGATPTNGNSDS